MTAAAAPDRHLERRPERAASSAGPSSA